MSPTSAKRENIRLCGVSYLYQVREHQAICLPLISKSHFIETGSFIRTLRTLCKVKVWLPQEGLAFISSPIGFLNDCVGAFDAIYFNSLHTVII